MGRAFDGCAVVSGPAGCWGDGAGDGVEDGGADGVAGGVVEGAAVSVGALGSSMVTLLPGLVCCGVFRVVGVAGCSVGCCCSEIVGVSGVGGARLL